MNISKAKEKADKLQEFVGQKVKGLTISYILPVTTKKDQIKPFIMAYLSTKTIDFAIKMTDATDFDIGILSDDTIEVEGNLLHFGGWFSEVFPDHPIPE